ncbi:MAG: GNAT family N-acetyltransferase [Desulfobacteraceae bacterium]|jgi:hypothetical protein
MSSKTSIIEVTENNIVQHPQAICFINPKHEFYTKKIEWLKDQFKNGLKIKLLYLEGEKRPIGFIEYVPGEYCWRSVNAKGYMFIHCLWTNGKKYQHQGFGTLLINEVEKDAKGMSGVAVVVSDKSFMANKEIFIKNGYSIVSESGKEQLIAKSFKKGPLPSINNWEKELKNYNKGLIIIYSKQCPWVARFIEEIKPILEEKEMNPRIVELKNAAEAQKAPSLYGAFNLIYNGKLLADRYISTTRFLNIVNKEIKQ